MNKMREIKNELEKNGFMMPYVAPHYSTHWRVCVGKVQITVPQATTPEEIVNILKEELRLCEEAATIATNHAAPMENGTYLGAQEWQGLIRDALRKRHYEAEIKTTHGPFGLEVHGYVDGRRVNWLYAKAVIAVLDK